MTTTLSVRVGVETKRRLETLAKRTQRSKSFLAAEAIAAYVDAEGWQVEETEEGLTDLAEGRRVRHEAVSRWLRSWGSKGERTAPRR